MTTRVYFQTRQNQRVATIDPINEMVNQRRSLEIKWAVNLDNPFMKANEVKNKIDPSDHSTANFRGLRDSNGSRIRHRP
ncbi:hypothetical protein OGAPHI_006219 [Ogataea philodendri]|uniref:Uncharacterized protein n=1 Tax=Ogataea philodendri TaxID=1378263 RepID=A0A9P8NY36_9ASCO|nr:uncharacterized protein OGAPHI_006219 [Ogataea philodendri]KAH3662038.1 hypothetical protein OGAPHI_006219 [Ogataea philodendri]